MRIVTMVLAVCLLIFVLLEYTTGYSLRPIALALLIILIPTFVYERWRHRRTKDREPQTETNE